MTKINKFLKQLETETDQIKCAKCGATGNTLRKLPLEGKDVYYCDKCLALAMRGGKDVREN